MTKSEVELPSSEWCWLGDWVIDKSGDVDNHGWAYAGTWAGFENARDGGHRYVCVRARGVRVVVCEFFYFAPLCCVSGCLLCGVGAVLLSCACVRVERGGGGGGGGG